MYFVLYKYQVNAVTRSEQFESLKDAEAFKSTVMARHGLATIQSEEAIIGVTREIPDYSDLDTYHQREIVAGLIFMRDN